MFNMQKGTIWGVCLTSALLVTSCADVSYVQSQSPANPYKDYQTKPGADGAIIGIGEPISKRQMRANALFSSKGQNSLERVMNRVAGTYNVAIRWGNGVRKSRVENILISDLSFDEARSYIEDVYEVQLVREGERRILILPSASEPRVELFAPGQNVKLAQALRGLAEQCDYNIMITENKEKLNSTQITTSLKDVTCYDAFGALLHPHGLSLEDHGDYYTVGGLPTRRWTVNLHEPDVETSRSVSYKSSFSGESDGSGSEQSVGGEAEVKVTSERKLWEELQTDLQDMLDNACEQAASLSAGASFGGGGDLGLPPPTLDGIDSGDTGGFDTGMSSSGGGGTTACGYVRVNKSVGVVQMQAPEHVLDEAESIIRRVEEIAGRRLVLEARVLAVKRTREFEQGSTLTSAPSVDNNPGKASSITAAISRALGTGSNGGLQLGYDGNKFDLALDLVEQYGTTYQLMQPMMELMDRQQATLIDGTTQPFIVREAIVETTDVGSQTNISVDLRYQFLGLQFSAEAQIAEEGEPHTVNIQIPILSKTGDFSVPVFSGSETIGNDNIPITETRLIDQKVRLRDGEVKVIGGLTKTLAIDKESGVPLFREVPVFGKALNEEDLEYEKVEFVVLLQVKRIQ